VIKAIPEILEQLDLKGILEKKEIQVKPVQLGFKEL
jgi:hypothetical protein